MADRPAAWPVCAWPASSENQAPGRRIHEPSPPGMADAEGYVTHSNVNAVVDEMVNMISASRSYQNNVEVMNTAQASCCLKTLQMGQ
jgi:flagellar basal-body rod protein FlgC